MKMNATDYRLLKTFIENAVKEKELPLSKKWEEYQEAGLSEIRFVWDLCRFAGVKIGDSVGMPSMFNFYDYLNDDHIATALKKINRELLSLGY